MATGVQLSNFLAISYQSMSPIIHLTYHIFMHSYMHSYNIIYNSQMPHQRFRTSEVNHRTGTVQHYHCQLFLVHLHHLGETGVTWSWNLHKLVEQSRPHSDVTADWQ